MIDHRVTRGVAWYRRLLILYPLAFRQRFGDSMAEAFAAEVEATRGPLGRAWLWTVTVAHALVHGIAERLHGSRREVGVGGRGPGVATDLAADLRVAVRTLRRRPGYATLVITTLTLGIGANAAIFSLVNAYLFAPLPFADSDRLVHLRDMVSRPGEEPWWYTPTPRSFHAVREGFVPFQDVAAHVTRAVSVRTDVDVVQAVGAVVSDRWMETLGIELMVGRGFSAEEQALGAQARAVVLSHDLWQRLMGGDPAALGRPLVLDGEPFIPIGVFPPGFNYPWGAELWMVGDFDRTSGVFGTGTVARLLPGREVEAVRSELIDFSRTIAGEYPDTHRDITFAFVSMREQLFGNRTGVSVALLGAVLLLLLTAGASVAGVSVARALSRDREMAVRSSLGAGRGRLVRLVLLEGVVLAAIGGGLALLATSWTGSWLTDLLAVGGTRLTQVHLVLEPDGRVAAFTIGVTLLVAALTALIPAVLATGSGAHGLSAATARTGLSRAARRALRGVVVAEVAFCVPLLLSAALVHEAFDRLASAERGYEAEDRVTVSLAFPERRYPDGAERVRVLRRMVERIEAEPGVVAAGYTHHLPVSPGDWTRAYSIDGIMSSESGSSVLANIRFVGPTYFDAIGMRMLQGRTFTEDEMDRAAAVVVLSADLARKHFGAADPVGRLFKSGSPSDPTPWREIVGVVEQAQEEWAFNETFYVPYSERPLESVELVVHAGPGVGAPAVRAAIQGSTRTRPPTDSRACRCSRTRICGATGPEP
jgi:predicted permease